MTDSFLLEKYDRPGPRYTSYPPVPFWTKTPSESTWISHVQTHGKDGIDLYIHIPFCQRICHYCGCNRWTLQHENELTDYLALLETEWRLNQKKIDRPLVRRIHIGGGTPSILSPSLMERLLSLTPFEVGSIELDPRTTTHELLSVLIHHGIRRVSFGVQDVHPHVLSLIGRNQPLDLVQRTFNDARELGFQSINIDLIHGLPGQTPESISESFRHIIALLPDSIAFYSFAYLPSQLSNQREIDERIVPQGAAKRELYSLGQAQLLSNGYREIGLDHFARESSFLFHSMNDGTLVRNFMGYTDQKSKVLIGMGCSSISSTPTSYIQNHKTLELYRESLFKGEWPMNKGHILSEEEQRIDEAIQCLMCQGKIPVSLIPDRNTFEELERDGLITFSNSHLHLTSLGRPFMRVVAMALDSKFSNSKHSFSRTV